MAKATVEVVDVKKSMMQRGNEQFRNYPSMDELTQAILSLMWSVIFAADDHNNNPTPETRATLSEMVDGFEEMFDGMPEEVRDDLPNVLAQKVDDPKVIVQWQFAKTIMLVMKKGF